MDSINTTIIIIIISIIVFYFIYNFDIYIIKKGNTLCDNILIEKKIINDINPFTN